MHEMQPPNGADAAPGDGASLLPSLRCEITREGDELIATIEGELDLASAPEVVRRLQAELARPDDPPVRTLTLELADLLFIDSSGLGALCQLHEQSGASGISMRLTAVPDHAMRVLEITGLTEMFGLS